MAVRLADRIFCVCLVVPSGQFFGGLRGIYSGVPHGGVVLPLVWLPHFNTINKGSREARRSEPLIFEDVN